MRFFLLLFCCTLSLALWAQDETRITGKIRDKKNKEPLPFVSVGFKGGTTGTTSDFEGNFSIHTSSPVDSLVVSYVGYRRFICPVKRGQSQVLLIELDELTNLMNEVVVKPGENPAIRIINNARDRKDKNSQSTLESYEYHCHNKTDISLNNISEEMKNRRVFKPLKSLFDTTNEIRNEEGRYIIPVFISENYSEFYYNRNPSKTKEKILATSISGVGVSDKSYLGELLGSS